ncbi:MAG: endonuclease/exonuclease/phosphatase family protein [Cyanobacteria bacterium J06632_22]
MKLLVRLLSGVCFVLVLGITGLALLANRYGWPIYLELFSHFQLQYFVGTSLLAALLLLLRRVRLGLIALFCCALLSAQVVTWYVPPGWTGTAGNYRVLIANLNVKNSDAARVLALTEQEKPDLALFMEVNGPMAEQLEGLKTTLPYSSNQSVTPHPGMVIYSKDPLSNVEVKLFGTERSQNLVGQLQVAGQVFSLVAAHPLPPVRTQIFHARNRLLDEMGQYVRSQSNPVILIGDLNTSMWSPYYRYLEYQTGLKNARDGHGIWPTWPTQGTYFNWPRFSDPLMKLVQIPIDHCLVSPTLAVTGFQTGMETGSDHLPVIVDLRLGSAVVEGSQQNQTRPNADGNGLGPTGDAELS